MSMKFNFKENESVKGRLDLKIRRKGVLVEEWGENLVVDAGRDGLAKLLGGQTGYSITKIALGSRGEDPAPGDTLVNAFTDVFKKAISSVSYPASGQVQFSFIITEADANGLSIRQFGLVCSNDVLFAHRTRDGKTIDKDDDISIEGTWTIYF
ncbi:hypothetical protein Dred_1222 [Desulforamulus reducens MI-1]|uniref:Uncharacterized protein n=1 Tax=Desulforamulus reducens (strain ATCC BAA-1160 / DSM 100696 / MI-1) TaxID=349161 RepID=A4J3V3_DESRM|nr:hypothetical protein [Desulforamulus reducens]ABO49756.1 hypothetical protein Dred_1222 [Desulforamulus reducens MI-1]